MFRRFEILAASAVLLAPAYAAKPCLRLHNIDTWSVPNDQTVIAEDYQRHKFKISLMGTCTGLRFNEGLAFQSVGGSQLSCLGEGDYVLRREQPSRCTIASVKPYAGPANGAGPSRNEDDTQPNMNPR